MTNVFVGHKLVDKCEKKARDMVGGRWGVGNRHHTKKYSKESLISMQAAGFIAECAMCIFLKLDPFEKLNWKITQADPGYDIKLDTGTTIDVKSSTHPGARRLIWPVRNVHKLPHAADILVLAIVPGGRRQPLGQTVTFKGYIERDRFIGMHWKAQGVRGIVDGSPYMDEKQLYNMDGLLQHAKDIKTTAERN